MKKKNKLPFRMLPASWGLTGKSRDIAEAEYYYSGADLAMRMAEINNDSEDDIAVAKLKAQLDNDVITKPQHDKGVADIRKEPFVNVVNMGIDPENVVQGYFELDWNDEFVKMLSDAGITGTNDEDIVNKWFNGVCRTVLLDAERDLDYGMQQQGQGRDDVIVTNSKQSKK
jgi:hypothetical protein